MSEKTNIQYLREAIANARFEEVEEWIDAIEYELNDKMAEAAQFKKDVFELEDDVSSLQNELEGIKEDWIDPSQLKTIDCGFGEIKYVEPDNLRLQMRMESIKEQMQSAALH